MRPLRCDELIHYLSDYIDNNLSEDLTAAAREHLATCRNCRVVLDSTQKTILLFREQGQHQEIPAERQQALYAQLLDVFLERTGEDES